MIYEGEPQERSVSYLFVGRCRRFVRLKVNALDTIQLSRCTGPYGDARFRRANGGSFLPLVQPNKETNSFDRHALPLLERKGSGVPVDNTKCPPYG